MGKKERYLMLTYPLVINGKDCLYNNLRYTLPITHKLTLGSVYPIRIIGDSDTTLPMMCRFVRVTLRGFNFINVATHTALSRPLYRKNSVSLPRIEKSEKDFSIVVPAWIHVGKRKKGT